LGRAGVLPRRGDFRPIGAVPALSDDAAAARENNRMVASATGATNLSDIIIETRQWIIDTRNGLIATNAAVAEIVAKNDRQMQEIGRALNAMTDRFHAIESRLARRAVGGELDARLTTLEAAAAIRRGSVATSGGDSEPGTIDGVPITTR
jgi:hypothetical protein